MQPSPSPEPPEQRSSQRVSSAERERVVALLREHTVDGRLTFDELAERARTVYAATKQEELDAVTRDLPALLPRAPEVITPLSGTPSQLGRVRASIRWTVAVLGGVNRRGRWRVHDRTNVVAVMGGCSIDLRQAVLDGPELVITAVACMGGIDVIVPEGIEVVMSGFALMGGRDAKLSDAPILPGTPIVHVRAFACMGGVSVRTGKKAKRQI